MASTSSSNSYYQANVYPLIADFLDDFEHEQQNAPVLTSPMRTSTVYTPSMGDYSNPGNNVRPIPTPSHGTYQTPTMSGYTSTVGTNNNPNNAYNNSAQSSTRAPAVSSNRPDNTINDALSSSYIHSLQSIDLRNSTPNDTQQNQYLQKLNSERDSVDLLMDGPSDAFTPRNSMNGRHFEITTTGTNNSPTESRISTYDPSCDPYNSISSLTPYNGYDKRTLPPKVQRFKEKRKMATAATAGAGVLVGGVIAGPLGMVVGGYGGYAIAKSVGKSRERKILEKCLNDEAGAKGANYKHVETAVLT
jgi:hypothetical protein